MHRQVLFWVGMLGVLMGAVSARAQPLAERVPEDALVYVGWSGAEALASQYEASNLKGVWEASTLADFIQNKLPGLLQEEVGADDAKGQANVKSLMAMGKIFWQHPTAFYLGTIEWTNKKEPLPRLAIVCEAGKDAPTLLSECLSFVTEEQGGASPVKAERVGDYVILTVGTFDTGHMMMVRGQGGAELLTRPQFVAALQQAQPKPAICVYVDVRAIVGQMDTWITEKMDERSRTQVKNIIDVLGIRSLRQAVYTGGFEEKGWTEYGFLGITGPKTGLVSLLDHKPLPEKTLEVVPKDALGFHAFQVDPGAVFTQLREGIGKVDRTMQRSFDLWMVQARGMLMFDIQKDLLAPLGEQWVLYEAVPSGDDLGGMALVNPLRDAAVMKRTIHTLESLLIEAGAQIDHARRDEVDFAVLRLPSTSVGWALAEGHLIVAQPGALVGAAKQVMVRKPSILENEDFQAMRERLGPPARRATAIDYANLPKMYPEIAESALGYVALASLPQLYPDLAGSGLGLAAVANVLGNLPQSAIPDADKAQPFLKSGGDVSWMDERGAHSKVIGAFPGAALLVGEDKAVGMGLSALATAMMVPVMQRAQEVANRAQDAANVASIAKACIIYATDHNNQMPAHLAELVASGALTTDQVVRPGSGTEAAVLTAAQETTARANWRTIQAIIDQHCDYIYLGGATTNSVNANCLLVLTKPGLDVSQSGVHGAYYDAHVDWLDEEGFKAAVEQTQRIRSVAQWPALDTSAYTGGN